MVYFNCPWSSAVCLSFDFVFTFRIALWSSAGKELSSWNSALADFILCRFGWVCVPLCVCGRM